MGFFKSKEPARPDPAKIRAEEEAKLKAENLKTIQAQEEKRRTLRSRLAADGEDEEGEISRKRLFGE